MDVMDEEVEEVVGFMDEAEEDFGEDSGSDELLVASLSQEEQLVQRLSEVDRCSQYSTPSTTVVRIELQIHQP